MAWLGTFSGLQIFHFSREVQQAADIKFAESAGKVNAVCWLFYSSGFSLIRPSLCCPHLGFHRDGVDEDSTPNYGLKNEKQDKRSQLKKKKKKIGLGINEL